MVCWPVTTPRGVYDTTHEAVIPVPLRWQLVWLNLPAPLDEKNTAPVGILAPVPDVCVTVEVHIVFALTTCVDGLQLRLVVVECPDITETVLRPPPFTT